MSTAGAGRDHPKMARDNSHPTPLRLVPGLHGSRVCTMRRPHGRALGRAGDVTRAGPTACTKTRRAELGMFNKAVAMRLLSPGLAPWWLMPFLAGQSELVFCADGMRVFFWAARFGRGPVSENNEKRCVFSPPLLNLKKKWPIYPILKKWEIQFARVVARVAVASFVARVVARIIAEGGATLGGCPS